MPTKTKPKTRKTETTAAAKPKPATTVPPGAAVGQDKPVLKNEPRLGAGSLADRVATLETVIAARLNIPVDAMSKNPDEPIDTVPTPAQAKILNHFTEDNNKTVIDSAVPTPLPS